jgi:hypothetical protein
LTPPRKATPRNFDRPTYGGHVAAVAAGLGRPLLPWQRYVCDVALEVDDAGVFVYSTVLITVQRQAGKTTLDLASNIQNALLGPRRRSWYTAQSGQHANEKFLEMLDDWSVSPLKALAPKPRRSNGSAALPFVNGSRFAPFPPIEGALDGKQVDKLTIDELWFFTAMQLSLMRASFNPAMATRRQLTGQRPQTWLMSTEGTVESTALNTLLDEARSDTPDPRTAFFDWGIRDDVDPTDLQAVLDAHPGKGFLLSLDDLAGFASQYRDEPGEFARGFGNRRTGATERVIPPEPWKHSAVPADTTAPDGPVCFGAAHGVDGVDTTITATQLYGPGTLTAVVKRGHGPGTTWALDRLVELQARHPQAAFAIDRFGPSASLHDAAERAGLRLVKLDAGAIITATQNTMAGITNPAGPTWRYKPHDALDQAAQLATKRFTGDGTWVFGRRASVGSISAIEAANVSSYGIHHMPAVVGFQLG